MKWILTIIICFSLFASFTLQVNESVASSVPFTSQAPTGRWSDQRQQDGCEEASSLMAVWWALGRQLPSASRVEKMIIDISNWEKAIYGSYNDTSAKDTAERILNRHLGFKGYKVMNKISLPQLKSELAAGRVVIAPMDGKKLKNPNFTAGGPDRHMLLIIGYDAKSRQFITNDPGTRRGQNYRYDEEVLYSALRDYPTGKHLPLRNLGKNVVSVSKKN